MTNHTNTFRRAAKFLRDYARALLTEEYRECNMLAAELDAIAKQEPVYVEGWTHGCDALLGEIDLWIPRCPHCGKEAPQPAKVPEEPK